MRVKRAGEPGDTPGPHVHGKSVICIYERICLNHHVCTSERVFPELKVCAHHVDLLSAETRNFFFDSFA